MESISHKSLPEGFEIRVRRHDDRKDEKYVLVLHNGLAVWKFSPHSKNVTAEYLCSQAFAWIEANKHEYKSDQDENKDKKCPWTTATESITKKMCGEIAEFVSNFSGTISYSLNMTSECEDKAERKDIYKKNISEYIEGIAKKYMPIESGEVKSMTINKDDFAPIEELNRYKSRAEKAEKEVEILMDQKIIDDELIKLGCLDLEVGRQLVDMSSPLVTSFTKCAKLKENKPYLFR